MMTLRELRLERHLTQEALARALGVSHSSVQNWELGDRPKMASRAAIAAYFGVEVNDVLWPDTETKEERHG